MYWFVSDNFKVSPISSDPQYAVAFWEYFRNLSDSHGLETNIYLSKIASNPGSSPATDGRLLCRVCGAFELSGAVSSIHSNQGPGVPSMSSWRETR